MTIDDPSATAPPGPSLDPKPESLRQALAGVRQVLLGIELTLLAGLIVLVSGPMGLAGLGAAVLGGVGFILALTGAFAASGERAPRS